MLSRSNSTVGDRLRRAKSTSSHTTTSSGHRAVTTIDPFVVRQQAEVAAVEAYNRAKQFDDIARKSYRPVPPKLQRRRSQNGGRTQGSHLEDARLGRRRSTSNKGESRAAQPARSGQHSVSEHTATAADSVGEERVVTRKRSVIPPSINTTQSQREHLAVPHISHTCRRSASSYGNGSPTQRPPATLREQSSTLRLSSTPSYVHQDGYGGNLVLLSDFSGARANIPSLNTPRQSIRETQTDEDILTMARDKCLQDFQQKKLRERKSFVAPFQRRATAFFGSSGNAYDNSIPPFNYADDSDLGPLASAPEPLPEIPLAPVMRMKKQSRNFSDTLKGRIKKAFQRVTKAPPTLPVQHVQSAHYHYPTDEDEYATVPRRPADPFITGTHEAAKTPVDIRSDTTRSWTSAGHNSGTNSRVTSWTNSTVAGTSTSRAENEQLPAIDSYSVLRRSASQRTLRKESSFFGRPVTNKLRRPSRPELKNSEESQGLYSALRERMRPRERTETPEQPTIDEQDPGLQIPLALSSQQQASLSGGKRHSTPTVRSVTPEPTAQRRSICSPVPEVWSPDGAGVAQSDLSRGNVTLADVTPRTTLQRRLATKAPTPSNEQLQRRMEKSRDRWQAPLDEFSPRPSKAETIENPYELPSLSQAHLQPPTRSDLPYHAKVAPPDPEPNRTAMLSPSLYSRGTDGASPRPITPVDADGMVVTITGREVRSYSISPPKKEEAPERLGQTSGQWRRWLSNEMGGFKSAQDDLNLAQAFFNGRKAQRSRSVSRLEHGGSRPASASPPPPIDVRPSSAATSCRRPPSSMGRPRASSRRSSFMNERYPMIETSRNSSDQSVRSRALSPLADERRGSSSEQEAIRPSLDNCMQRSVFSRPRVVTGRASIAYLESAARNKSPPLPQGTHADPMMSGALTAEPTSEPVAVPGKAAVPSVQRAAKSTKTKSDFDLRANYKNTHTGGRSTPIEIRRKRMIDHTNMLEDSTIRNISAGPYAAHSLPLVSRNENKENSPPPEWPETAGLASLSSSEWLALGPNKARKPSTLPVHPAYRNRSMSRYSPPKSPKEGNFGPGAGRGGGGKGSPAQRMASEWLEKRSRENTPAFV